MDAGCVRETVEAHARSIVSCPEHESPLGEVGMPDEWPPASITTRGFVVGSAGRA